MFEGPTTRSAPCNTESMQDRAHPISPVILTLLFYAAALVAMLLAAAVVSPPRLPPHTVKMPLTIQGPPKNRDTKPEPARKVPLPNLKKRREPPLMVA